MLSRFVFCTLIVGYLAVPDRSKISVNGTKAVHTEIIDNKLVEDSYAIDYPYMIELDKAGRHKCGGALIRPNIALTARHCFKNYKRIVTSEYELLAGNQIYQDRKSSFVQVRQVEKVVVHRTKLRSYDLAVMKTTEPFDLNTHVNVVKVAPQTLEKRYTRKRVVTLGWGATGTAAHSKYLMKLYGRVVQCSYEALLCMYGEFGGGTRDGDSGGPTVIQRNERKNDLLIGIHHGGFDNQYFAVNLAEFSDWIKETAESLNK